MKQCPYCAEEIQDEAIKCRFCGEALKTNEYLFKPSGGHAANVSLDELLTRYGAGELRDHDQIFDPSLKRWYYTGTFPAFGSVGRIDNREGTDSDRPDTTTRKSMIRNLLWIIGVITVCPLVYIAGECVGKGQQISLPVNQVLKRNGAPKDSAKSFDTQKVKSQDGKSCSGKKLQKFSELRKAWSLGVSKDEFNATCPVINNNEALGIMTQLCEDGVKRIISFMRDTHGVFRVNGVNASSPADDRSCKGIADETARRMGEPPVTKTSVSWKWYCDESSVAIILGLQGDTCEFFIQDVVNN